MSKMCSSKKKSYNINIRGTKKRSKGKSHLLNHRQSENGMGWQKAREQGRPAEWGREARVGKRSWRPSSLWCRKTTGGDGCGVQTPISQGAKKLYSCHGCPVSHYLTPQSD